MKKDEPFGAPVALAWRNIVRRSSIDLRLGHFFLRCFSTVVRPYPTQPFSAHAPQRAFETVRTGDFILITPGETIVVTTLEYLRIPADVVGVLTPRRAWSRVGLTLASQTIHPGFQGNRALLLSNVSAKPIALYPLARIAKIWLSSLHRLVDCAGAPVCGRSALPSTR